jgi:hypothetical protein
MAAILPKFSDTVSIYLGLMKIENMGEMRNEYKILVGNHEGDR